MQLDNRCSFSPLTCSKSERREARRRDCNRIPWQTGGIHRRDRILLTIHSTVLRERALSRVFDLQSFLTQYFVTQSLLRASAPSTVPPQMGLPSADQLSADFWQQNLSTTLGQP